MDTLPLSAGALARDVANCFSEMHLVAGRQWSMQQLRSPAGTCFLAALDDRVQAFERFEPNAYLRLCQAIALRLAILLREGATSLSFCGCQFDDMYVNAPPLAFDGFEAC